jgi:hypothetical protein
VIVRSHLDAWADLLGSRCAHCSRQVLDFPFMQWDLIKDEDSIPLVFHPECANKLVLRIARDLHEIETRR